MVVRASDVIEVRYADAPRRRWRPPAPTSLTPPSRAARRARSRSRPACRATTPRSPSSTPTGPATDRGDGRRTLDVTVTGPGGETESVTLTESAAMDGTYAGAIPTAFDTNPARAAHVQ